MLKRIESWLKSFLLEAEKPDYACAACGVRVPYEAGSVHLAWHVELNRRLGILADKL